MKKCRSICSLLLLGGLTLASCSKDGPEPTPEVPVEADAIAKEAHKERFAAILSKAVYERQDVRTFLKTEALVQFDKNYDIFYPMVKAKTIGGESFREILLSHSSEQELSEIERNVPLLNILLADIPVLGIKPGAMDVADEEIPVAVAKESATALYLNGVKEGDLEKGEVPGFHLFVVNENKRVEPVRPQMQKMASAKTERGQGKTIPGTSFAFKDPNYDGTVVEVQPLLWRSWWEVDWKAIQAWNYFYKDDGSINQRAYQRDYIYYGITPQNRTGSLNRSVREYISFIEVNPNVYFKISDQEGDPRLKETWFQHYGSGLSTEDLINRMWTEGSYNFRFEFISAGKTHAQVKEIPLRPEQLWDFHIGDERRNRTWFRRERHTYSIDVRKFTPKTVPLIPSKIDLDPWDLAEEGLYRHVNIYEEDGEVETTTTETYESVHVNASKFQGGGEIKLGVGPVSMSVKEGEKENTSSSTVKKSTTVTRKYKQGSDYLGSSRIYFYDPIILGKLNGWFGPSYDLNFYNTGSVKFGISVK